MIDCLATGASVLKRETAYYHVDHLGTPQKLTNASQAIVWDASYKPFGEAMLVTNTMEQPLRVPGQYFDAETGLHQNWHRDYDPSIGRYLQSDPIGLVGGLNTYGYATQNPLRFVDPTGLINEFSYKAPNPAEIAEMKERSCAREAFLDAYFDMREAFWVFSDKYFHCRANCEATKCGKYGYEEACKISGERELTDQLLGDTKEQVAADLRVNEFGRDEARRIPTRSCQVVCSIFRPPGLPAQY